MSPNELYMAKERLASQGVQLSVATKTGQAIINGLIAHLRGKLAVLIEDNNKAARLLNRQMTAINLRIKAIALEERAAKLKRKGKKNGK
jgi:hypothetical protein